jgi:hypothetical protein
VVTAAPHAVLALFSKTPLGYGFGAGISEGNPHPAIKVLESSEGGATLIQAVTVRQRRLP